MRWKFSKDFPPQNAPEYLNKLPKISYSFSICFIHTHTHTHSRTRVCIVKWWWWWCIVKFYAKRCAESTIETTWTQIRKLFVVYVRTANRLLRCTLNASASSSIRKEIIVLQSTYFLIYLFVCVLLLLVVIYISSSTNASNKLQLLKK